MKVLIISLLFCGVLAKPDNDLGATVRRLEAKVAQYDTIQAEVAELRAVNTDLTERTKVLETRLMRLGEATHSLAKKQQSPGSQVGSAYFQAYRLTKFTGSDTQDTTILFDTVNINVKNAYNPLTGIFTAPTKGYYQFSHHVMPEGADCVEGADGRLVTKLMVNSLVESQKISAYPNTASQTHIVSLNAADQVWISIDMNRDCRVISDYNQNGFSGYLITEIV